jgi:nitrogen fixation/metabolism regulation signal transduction histidine kinase
MKLKHKFSQIYTGLIGSLDNKKNTGFSARKITVLIIVICIILIHLSWLKHAFLREDYKFIVEILSIDSLFVLLLLGIVTLEQISKLKNGNKNEIKEEK